MKNFECLGGDCPDTCCASWGIELTSDCQRRLKPAVDGIEGGYDAVIETYAESRRGRVGCFRFGSDNRCPLLSSEGLCSVHASHGEAFLPLTCASYPRAVGVRPQAIEVGGFLSCPEVARRLIETSDPFALVDSHIDVSRLEEDQRIDSQMGYESMLDEVRVFVARLGEGLALRDGVMLMARFCAATVAWFNRSSCQQDRFSETMRHFSTPSELDELIKQPVSIRGLQAVGETLMQQLGDLVVDDGRYARPKQMITDLLTETAWTDHLDRCHRWPGLIDQLDDPLHRYVTHHWLTRWYTNGPDLDYHMDRLALKLALIRIVVFARRDVQIPAADAMVDAIYAVDRLVEHHGWVHRCRRALSGLNMTGMELTACLLAV